ncbi:hypothetical protein [Georgenia sunbinii]|uniref:hypothetical protein n=1 Tax=Georgenia sunbinii TaxID=3117728 RepID=UPI002F2623C0
MLVDVVHLVTQAFEAFTVGFTTAAGVGAGILVLAAVITGVLLRKTPADQPAAEHVSA